MRMICFALLLSVTAGCQSSRSSMQMDSNSNTPFFSLQMPIKNAKSQAADVEVAVEQPVEQATPLIRPLSMQNKPQSESRWGSWLDKLRHPISIPVPRTDISDEGEVVEPEVPEVDGLHDF